MSQLFAKKHCMPISFGFEESILINKPLPLNLYCHHRLMMKELRSCLIMFNSKPVPLLGV